MVRIIPRDTSFFDMFAAMANNLVDAARALVELFADYRDVDKKIEEIRRIEHLGDEMTHSIMRKLNQTFITLFRSRGHSHAGLIARPSARGWYGSTRSRSTS